MGLVKLDEWGMVRLEKESGSMNFYKCASVDTTNHKWSGYLASVNPVSGVWDFAETATPNLPYDRLTPQVGKVYDENCTFMVSGYKTGLPTDGLIFYLPLDADPGSTDVTGKALAFRHAENIVYGQNVQGILCTKFSWYDAALSGPDFASLLPNDSSTELTVSCWALVQKDGGFGLGDKAASSGFPYIRTGIRVNHTEYRYDLRAGSESDLIVSTSVLSGIHHFAATYKDDVARMYCDGSLVGSGAYKTSGKPFGDLSAYYPVVAGKSGWTSTDYQAYFAAFRIYNRVLDDSEISALAAEFTPTAAS